MTAREQISKTQFFNIIIQSQIGIAILTLPYQSYQSAKYNGWLSVLLAGIIIEVIILLIWLLARKFPSLHFFEVINLLLGKKIGGAVCLLYVIYFIIVSGIVLSLYSNIVSEWLLPYTPQWITKVLMVSIGIYVAKDSLQNISRFFVLCTLVLL
ncbi:GerAB/ArcD/ProY family transporter, partial [Bacillus sp. JJ722]|uniref:GerAB/ArcD/ProY family transporter n=1 Tax=Bacillus sp. JJ722 TaxID=3122973 RepID=UPI002FFEBD09